MNNTNHTTKNGVTLWAVVDLVVALVVALAVALPGTSSCGRQATKQATKNGTANQQAGTNHQSSGKPTTGPTTHKGADTPNVPRPGTTILKPVFPPPTKQELGAVVSGANQFAVDLYQKLSEKQGNLFFSPWSISVALAMTRMGARGKTAAEMETALHFPKEHVNRAFGSLLTQMPMALSKGVVLNMANRLFPQAHYALKPAFTKGLDMFYHAAPVAVDYHNRAAAIATINKWVKEQTAGRIAHLLKEPDMSPRTKLVLVNTIYFKGIWKTKFKKRATNRQNFFTSPKTPVKVDMMHGSIDARYAETPGSKVLELDYAGHRFSMVIVLPNKRNGLAALEKSLTSAELSRMLTSMTNRKVEVSLPRMHLDRRQKLNHVLKSLGIKLAFSERRADFSGMSSVKPGLFIFSVVHQANCDVDEQGTVAAAATAVIMATKAMSPRRITFIANHPFIFLIRDRKTGAILFMGRFARP